MALDQIRYYRRRSDPPGPGVAKRELRELSALTQVDVSAGLKCIHDGGQLPFGSFLCPARGPVDCFGVSVFTCPNAFVFHTRPPSGKILVLHVTSRTTGEPPSESYEIAEGRLRDTLR